MKLTIFALAVLATPLANAAPIDLVTLVGRQAKDKELSMFS